MARVLMTGVSGFTGRYLAPRLVADGHEIHGLMLRPTEGQWHDIAAAHYGSLHESSKLREIIAKVRPQHVIHLAAIAFVAHGSVDDIYQTNIIGTRTLLQSLIDEGVAPRSVLIASSANVYGNAREGVLDENTPPVPANDYGVSKLAMEHVARIYGERIPIILTRPFNYTGVGQSVDYVIPKIVDHIRKRLPQIELGNLDVARDFSDVRVVVDAYARLLDCPSAVGRTFNVCSGQSHSLKSILDLAQAIGGHHLDISVNPMFSRANEVRTLCGSKRRLESTIGGVTPTSLDAVLRWMIES